MGGFQRVPNEAMDRVTAQSLHTNDSLFMLFSGKVEVTTIDCQ